MPDDTNYPMALDRTTRARPHTWRTLGVALVVSAGFGGCGKSNDTNETTDAGGESGTAGSTAQVSGAGAGSATDTTGGNGTGGTDTTGGTGTGVTASGGTAGAGATDTGGANATGAAGAGATDTGGAGTAGTGGAGAAPTVRLPPPDAQFDYQLGGAYDPPEGAQIVSRDRNDPPAPGLYNICYVNGFQTQPDEQDWWLTEHPELVLRDHAGDPVVDEDWGELLLDVSTADQREALAAIVGAWIAGCAADGFDAVELDNLDSYSRSDGLLEPDQAVAFMAALSEVAHEHGLAFAQKNSVELLGDAEAMGTDFAVAEECNRWDECAEYQTVYGNRVFVIEYRDPDFTVGCDAFPELSIIRRDLDLTTPASSSYVYDAC
ncbi:MAG: endo alpha-1,4 polygalactosaminidase [Polyangiaceae bacterium]|nr:endo alpha-1,4 polygalactosaminidase [Polyangiaceae bacterium]